LITIGSFIEDSAARLGQR